MAWERRTGGGLYYTRSRRVGGRVTREYVGTGLGGKLAEIEDKEARARRDDARHILRTEQERWDTVDAALSKTFHETEALTRCALVLAGYHQHHRGEWRKWRAR